MWPKAVQLQTKHYGSKEELKTYISEEREGGGRKEEGERELKPLSAAEIIQLHFCFNKIRKKLWESHTPPGINSDMHRENI